MKLHLLRPVAAWRRSLLPLLIAASFVLASPGLFVQAAQAEILELTGSGSASYKKKKDAMRAREDAIETAIITAVRKGLQKFVSPDIYDKNKDTIENELLPTAVALVKSYDVISEKERDKTYTVIIKAKIDQGGLQSNLQSLGISQDVGSRKSIAILIQEYATGDYAPSNEPVVAEKIDIHTIDAGSQNNVQASSSEQNDVQAKSSSSESSRSSSRARASGSASRSSSASSSARGNAYSRSRGGGSSTYAATRGRGSSASASASGSSRASFSGSSANSASSSSRDSASFSDNSSKSADFSDTSSSHHKEMKMSVTKYLPPEKMRQPRPDPVSAARIGSMLMKKDVRLVDADVLNKVRDGLVGQGGLLIDIDNATLSRQALEMGSQYGFDAMMVGVTAITRDDANESGGQFAANATLAVRIVDAATGDIVAMEVSQQRGLGSTFNQSADASATRLGDILGKQLGDQLFQYWKKRAEKGFEITVRLKADALSTRLKIALSDALMGIEGAEDVSERIFDKANGIVEYTVTTKRQLTKFKNDMFRSLYSQSALENVEEEMSLGTNWNLVLKQ